MTDRIDVSALKGYIDWDEMARVANRYGRVAVFSLYLPDDEELGDTMDLFQREAAEYGLLIHDECKMGDRVFIATPCEEDCRDSALTAGERNR